MLLLLRYKGTGVLLPGMEADVENYLVPEWNGYVDVKVAHHGSNTSSTDEWLDVLSPQLAVIQVGKNSLDIPILMCCKDLKGKRHQDFPQ